MGQVSQVTQTKSQQKIGPILERLSKVLSLEFGPRKLSPGWTQDRARLSADPQLKHEFFRHSRSPQRTIGNEIRKVKSWIYIYGLTIYIWSYWSLILGAKALVLDPEKYIETHCHLTDDRLSEELCESWIQEARSLGFDFFLQGGVGPEDWDKQVVLEKKHPGKIGLCFGLHPYWIASHEEEECNHALDLLSQKIHQAHAFGETGLDFRPSVLTPKAGLRSLDEGRAHQIEFFSQQIELSHIVEKPLVLHLVQAHESALKTLDSYGPLKVPALIHSFNGSWGQAEEYLRRGLYLSVGGPVARQRNKKLQEAVRRIPSEKLLLETDSPDQASDFYRGQLNPLAAHIEVAKTVGHLREQSYFEILKLSARNFRRIFAAEEIR